MPVLAKEISLSCLFPDRAFRITPAAEPGCYCIAQMHNPDDGQRLRSRSDQPPQTFVLDLCHLLYILCIYNRECLCLTCVNLSGQDCGNCFS
jgi:hypothetical protein